jgi:hypothetical protein
MREGVDMANGKVILVSGALANKYANGGEAWVRLSWVRGLQRLGFDVYFVEQIAPEACVDSTGCRTDFESCGNRDYFRTVMSKFELTGRAALICDDAAVEGDGRRMDGMAWDRMVDVARAAELLVNVSGHLTLEPLTRALRRKAYIDIDPGFTQFWHAEPTVAFSVAPHDHYFTIGENIGTAGCPIPLGGLHWRPTRQPVVLDDWPLNGKAEGPSRFTTVASWRGAFGPVEFAGKTYRVKAHEFRKVLDLPRRVPDATFEIALDIHPGDARDSAALVEHGWRLTDPRAASDSPEAFRQYVQGSAAEFSVAQGIYVDTSSGWFSDRTVRYLASGKPALVQETGFSRNIAGTGVGLVPFSTPEEAADGAKRILRDYAAHAEVARATALRYFDSDRVLGQFVDEVGIHP